MWTKSLPNKDQDPKLKKNAVKEQDNEREREKQYNGPCMCKAHDGSNYWDKFFLFISGSNTFGLKQIMSLDLWWLQMRRC